MKEVFGIIVDKNRVKAKTFLQQVLKLLLERIKKTFPTSNTSIVKKKAITLISVFIKKQKAKKLA